MRLSANPDLGSARAMAATAAVVTLVVWTMLAWQKGHISASLGDTDDATRMVLVRGLLAGRGWFDQILDRLQPPAGLQMHWSRLIDGGLAALIWLAERVVSPAQAELAVRFAWPLMWIVPAVVSAMAIADSLGDRAAVLVAAVLMIDTKQLFVQFVPGRVDHHNLQIVLILAAIAAALRAHRRPPWAVAAGVASGLGLAIGLEGLIFQGLVGASFALRLARDRNEGKVAAAYGLGLFASTAFCFAVETAPWRWGLSFCDEIGLNLVVAVAAAGLGLTLVSAIAGRASGATRIALISLVGAAAGGIYLALDPACIHGPFDALDPRVRPFWFDRIQEIQPWSKTILSDRGGSLREMAAALLAVAAAVFVLLRQGRKADTGAILMFLCVVAAALATASARRMEAYLLWFGAPVLAAAVSLAARAWLGDRLVPTLVATIALSPALVGDAAAGAADFALGRPPPSPPSATGRCFATRAYGHLAALPAGLVISETDLGPFILASTQDQALAAPYHRMSGAILAGHNVLAATPQGAEALARAAGARYIVDCPPYPMMVGAGSLGAALRQGKTPGWLERLTTPSEVLQIYRLRAAGALESGPGVAVIGASPVSRAP